MKEKLNNWYHKYILCEKHCPNCGEWMKNTGINMAKIWEDEYYCEHCNKYIYM